MHLQSSSNLFPPLQTSRDSSNCPRGQNCPFPSFSFPSIGRPLVSHKFQWQIRKDNKRLRTLPHATMVEKEIEGWRQTLISSCASNQKERLSKQQDRRQHKVKACSIKKSVDVTRQFLLLLHTHPILLYVADEAGEGGVPADLDGQVLQRGQEGGLHTETWWNDGLG